jgi:predicted DNA-binding transcriptional regulator AlpA
LGAGEGKCGVPEKKSQDSLDNVLSIIDTSRRMKIISTRQAAKKLGIHFDTLARYVAAGKLPAPTILEVGTRTVHAWTETEIEHVRKLLPKIANGRKTRYKKHSAISSQQSAKAKKKTQARVPAPHKKK